MFNLFNFGDELTLPEQVEQNKQNIELLAEEVEKLGFSPRGEYDATAEYVKNDLVFYDGKMYAVKSDVAVVGVVPTNTEYWQQITGDVRGQAGAPGAPGAQGEKGDDGADGLTFTGYFIAQQPPVYLSERYFTNTLFNRTPKVNDTFVAYYKVGNTVYLTMYRVLIVDSTQAYCRLYQDPILLNGEKGETGEPALIYDKNINAGTLDPEQSEQLLSVVLSFANFNRTPALNEDFVGVLVAQNIEYLAQCEVQSIIGSNVVSIVVSGVKRLTGENGTNGTNGANGKDALVYSYIYSTYSEPAINTSKTITAMQYFNRTPEVNDFVVLIINYVTGSKTYIAYCTITAVSEDSATVYINSIVETTGQAGTSEKHYAHHVHFFTGNQALSIYFTIFNKSSETATYNDVLDYLKQTNGTRIFASGSAPISNAPYAEYIFKSTSSLISLHSTNGDKTTTNDYAIQTSSLYTVDVIVEI